MSLTQAQLAAALGVHPAVVTRDKAQGMPTHTVEAAREWRGVNRRQRVGTRTEGGPGVAGQAPMPPSDDQLRLPVGAPFVVTPKGDASYNEARARRERAEAEEAEMRTARIRGTMVQREDIDRGCFEIARELRDRLAACARRIASEVAAIDSAEGCEAVIDREHRIVLELLVSGIREKLGSPLKVTP
jgi:hypothetical protein